MVAPFVIPPASTQLLLCIAADWDSSAGELQCFTRNADGNWQPAFAPLPVMLGRSGLAWGHGLHPLMAGTAKQEGDGRAPAGVFAITALFGYAPADAPLPRAARLPYHPARPGLKCVDDPKSGHYNCIVDAAGVPSDWASCEDMLRDDRRYELGAVVAHNTQRRLPGAGSCIFLHVWETPETPTSGCTAMALDHMEEIARWLDAARAPVLVQLPEAEYARHQQAWGLPRR